MEKKLGFKAPTKDRIIESDDPILTPQILSRRPEHGASTFHATGKMLSGKTTFLIRTSERLFQLKNCSDEELLDTVAAPGNVSVDDISPEVFDNVRDEKIFWRGLEECQWDRVPREKKIFVEDGLNVNFYTEGRPLKIRTVSFESFDELYGRADPNYLNVMYMENGLRFIDFIRYLIDEIVGPAWSSVFVDEWEDVAAANLPKPYYHYVAKLKNGLKRSRKARVSFYAATQRSSEIDYRCLNKIMNWLFLPGAKKPGDQRVWQRAIDNLKLGEGYFSDRSFFEKISFKNYPPKHYMRAVGLPEEWSLEDMVEAEGL